MGRDGRWVECHAWGDQFELLHLQSGESIADGIIDASDVKGFNVNIIRETGEDKEA